MNLLRKDHAMKIGGVAPRILNLALNGGEWLVSRSSNFFSRI